MVWCLYRNMVCGYYPPFSGCDQLVPGPEGSGVWPGHRWVWVRRPAVRPADGRPNRSVSPRARLPGGRGAQPPGRGRGPPSHRPTGGRILQVIYPKSISQIYSSRIRFYLSDSSNFDAVTASIASRTVLSIKYLCKYIRFEFDSVFQIVPISMLSPFLL